IGQPAIEPGGNGQGRCGRNSGRGWATPRRGFGLPRLRPGGLFGGAIKGAALAVDPDPHFPPAVLALVGGAGTVFAPRWAHRRRLRRPTATRPSTALAPRGDCDVGFVARRGRPCWPATSLPCRPRPRAEE